MAQYSMRVGTFSGNLSAKNIGFVESNQSTSRMFSFSPIAVDLFLSVSYNAWFHLSN
jgi:hypothetical protein